MRAVWVLALTALLGACTRRIAALDLSDEPGAVLFVVPIDAAGRPTRVSPALVVSMGLNLGAESSPLELSSDEVAACLVRLDRPTLASSFPGYLADDPNAVRLVAASAPNQVREVPGSGGLSLVQASLPAAAGLFRVPAEAERVGLADLAPLERDQASTLAGGLTLEVDVDSEYCRPSSPRALIPFAAEARPMAGVGGLGPVHDIVYLDDDRVLVAAGGVVLLQRGQPFVADEPVGAPGTMISKDSLRSGIDVSWSVLFLPPSAVDVRERALLVGELDNKDGIAFELQIFGDRLALIRTATITPHWPLLRARRAPDGRIAILTEGGRVYWTDDRLSSFSFETIEQAGAIERLLAVDFPDDPLVPMVVGGNAHVYVKRLDGGWTSQRLNTLGDPMAVTGVDSVRRDGVLEVLASADHGHVFRHRGDGAWQDAPLRWPPRYSGCQLGSVMEQQQSPQLNLVSLAILGDYALIGIEHCNTIAALRLDDNCISLITVADQVPTPTDDDLLAVDQRAGEVLFAGKGGFVLVTTP